MHEGDYDASSISQLKNRFIQMKKIYILSVLLLCSIGVFAQDEVINIPDANFKKALLNHNPVIDTNGDGEIQKSEAKKYTGNVYVYGKQIKALTGIEYFENLIELNCSNNQLTTLDLSKNTNLTKLFCTGNKLIELDFSKNIELQELYCYINELTQLNVSKNIKLKVLSCSDNQLIQLNISENTNLEYLRCSDNQLTQLDISKDINLVTLYCSNNQLTQLNISENTNLEYLRCSNNQLTQLDISKNIKLKETDCSKNAIDLSGLWSIKASLPLGCNFKYKQQNNIYSMVSVSEIFEVDYTGQAIINCNNTTFKWYNVSGELVDDNSVIEPVAGVTGKYLIKKDGAFYCEMSNPEFPEFMVNTNIICFSSSTEEVVDIPDANFKKCLLKEKMINSNQDGEIQLNEAQNYSGKIWVFEKNIRSLKGIEYFKNITELNCRSNKLTQLDISKNVNLTKLHFSSNKVEQLDISKNTKLYELNCGSNKLKQLDISGNVRLIYLECRNNQLTQLDISKNTNLYTLDCCRNQITQLELSKNTKLRKVECYENQLTQLDISKNKRLAELACQNNKLTELDLSNNYDLKRLSFGYNQLTQLDISDNTKLERLYCHSCQLTKLDISKNTQLTILNCSNNKLDELDISKNTEIEDLYCYGNRLTQLDVSENTKLEQVNCINNKISFSELWNIKENISDECQFKNQPQNKIYDENRLAVDTQIDYSSELNVNGKTTTFVWYNSSTHTEVDETSVKVIEGGKFKFLQQGEYYCVMTNDEFKGLKLQTNTIIVLKSQTISFDPSTTANINDKITLEATASSGMDITFELVSGKATLDGNVLTATTEGTLVVKAVQAGNSEYAMAEKEVTILVTKHSQTLTFNPPAKAKINDKITLEATASTGMDVAFELVSGKATLAANILTPTAEGALVVKAIQTGNAEYAMAEKVVTIQVSKYDQILTFNPVTTAKVNDNITLEATVSTGLDVAYEIVSGEATLDGNTLTPTAEGALVVKAVQAGNAEYGLVEKEVTIQVSKRNQTITFAVEETVKVNDKVTLEATASTGLEVTYEIVSGEATLDGNVVTFTKAGVVEIKATQAGNNEYKAVEKTVTITVTKSTAIDNLSAIGAKIYPNPVAEILNIELPTAGNYTVSIFNSIGDIVTQKTTLSATVTINMSAFKGGIYIVKITTDNRIYTGKIVKR